jgi:hypothetical protein
MPETSSPSGVAPNGNVAAIEPASSHISTETCAGPCLTLTVALPGSHATRYQIQELLGKGATSVVMRATRVSDGLDVAIKFLARAPDADVLARFEREARLMQCVRHPNVVHVLEYFSSLDQPSLVCEYLRGGSLRDLLDRRRLTDSEAVAIALQCLKGLEACHAHGIIHRDLKPGNVLLDTRGVAKIADLGIAKMLGTSTYLTRTGDCLGTPLYMAPEQWRIGELQNATDIFAMGAILYEMLCGKRLRDGLSAHDVMIGPCARPPVPLAIHRPDLSPALVAVVEQMVAERVEDRPASAAVAAQLIAEACRPTRRSWPGWVRHFREKGRSHAVVIGALAVALAMVYSAACIHGVSGSASVTVLSDIEQLLKNERWSDALALFGRAPDRPEDLRRWTALRAQARVACGDREGGDEDLDVLRRLSPTDPILELCRTSSSEAESERWSYVHEAHALQILANEPRSAAARLVMARHMVEVGRLDMARKLLPSRCPEGLIGVARWIWADCLVALGRTTEAVSFYRKSPPSGFQVPVTLRDASQTGSDRAGLSEALLGTSPLTEPSQLELGFHLLLAGDHSLAMGTRLKPEVHPARKLSDLEAARLTYHRALCAHNARNTSAALKLMPYAFYYRGRWHRRRVLQLWEKVLIESGSRSAQELAIRQCEEYLRGSNGPGRKSPLWPVGLVPLPVSGTEEDLRLFLVALLLKVDREDDARTVLRPLDRAVEIHPDNIGRLIHLLAATGQIEKAFSLCRTQVVRSPWSLPIQWEFMLGVRSHGGDAAAEFWCRRLAQGEWAHPRINKWLAVRSSNLDEAVLCMNRADQFTRRWLGADLNDIWGPVTSLPQSARATLGR